MLVMSVLVLRAISKQKMAADLTAQLAD